LRPTLVRGAHLMKAADGRSVGAVAFGPIFSFTTQQHLRRPPHIDDDVGRTSSCLTVPLDMIVAGRDPRNFFVLATRSLRRTLLQNNLLWRNCASKIRPISHGRRLSFGSAGSTKLGIIEVKAFACSTRELGLIILRSLPLRTTVRTRVKVATPGSCVDRHADVHFRAVAGLRRHARDFLPSPR